MSVRMEASAALQPARSPAFGSVLGTCGLAALLYALAVGHLWPEAALMWPLLSVFLAAAIGAVAGFGFAPICAVMLVHLIGDPVRIVALILVGSIALQLLCIIRLWRQMDWHGGLFFLVGALATLPFGLMLLQGMTGRGHAMILGGLLVAYAGWMLWRPATQWRVGRQPGSDVLVGALGGITGGIAGFPSAPLVAWCGLLGLGRIETRSLIQPYIVVIQIAALLLLHLTQPSGRATPGLDPTLLLAMAPALFGTLCGLALYERLSDRQFGRAVNLLLLVSGLGMLV